jgi:ParB-like chromosome segregation protein Spo0J
VRPPHFGLKEIATVAKKMDHQMAMQRSFKENVKREPLSPVDEAGWFFKMFPLVFQSRSVFL